MNKKFNYNNCKVGDRVCFKSDEEKEDFKVKSGYKLDGVVYGVITFIEDTDVVGVSWINHKGIVIDENVGVYYSRLKFYNE